MPGIVNDLENGIDTLVGEGGRQTSGGQAQRILLARLWYHRTNLVLVDEGTSALDPETEQSIHRVLKKLASDGAIVITIAHRQSAAELADCVINLKSGSLIQDT
mgnify:CR=1 FL=1